MKTLDRTKENPLPLKTPPGTSDFTMYADTKDGAAILVCTVGKTVLHYDARCVADLHAMLKAHGDWMELGGADRRLVWLEERFARALRRVRAAADGGAGPVRTGAQSERQSDAGEVGRRASATRLLA